MAGIQNILDTREDSQYNIIINKDRDLNQKFECYFLSGTTEVPFDFSPYSGAVLQVRKTFDSTPILLEFNTTDGSITLNLDGSFNLIRTAAELSELRSTDNVFDMYLSSTSKLKRAFLSGEFIIKNRVSI